MITRFVSLFLLVWSTFAYTQPKLIVGLTGKYPPFNFFDSQSKLTGFDVDFAEAICDEIDRQCEFKILAWDGILSALLAKRIDVIIGSMAITEEREKAVRFTTPYYESGAQLFVTPQATTPPKIIGVTLGTSYGEYAKKAFPQSEIKTYKGDIEILQDVGSGRVHAFITDRLVGLYMAQQMNANVSPRGSPLYLEEMGIPIHPDNGPLHQILNTAVKKIRQSGQYQQLMGKYFGKESQSQTSTPWAVFLQLLIEAAFETAKISFLGIAIGGFIAVILSIGVLGLPKPLSLLLSFAIDFVRATPFMIQIFALYFGLPALGISLSPWTAGTLAIALHSSAYLSEILKNSYQSIPKAQSDAAATLGLGRFQTLRWVLIPQMIPLFTPAALNTVVAMIKDSAIVSIISVHELTMQSQQIISATFQPMQWYAIAAVLYFCLTYPLLFWGKRLEKQFRAKGLLHA